jgi:hypothetical protein
MSTIMCSIIYFLILIKNENLNEIHLINPKIQRVIIIVIINLVISN